jgi:hypothetical protein
MNKSRDCSIHERYTSPSKDDALPSSSGNTFLQDMEKESRETVLRLMSHIDCRRIHPILLAKMVEPLKVIAPEHILSSLWFHALRRHMIYKSLECGWDHGEPYRVLDQGFRIQRAGNKIGVAVASVAMSRPFGVYKWRFVLEEICTVFVEFGFIQFEGGLPQEKEEFDGKRLSEWDHARLLCYTGATASVNWQGDGRSNWKALGSEHYEPMFFTYDAAGQTCSLSLAGKDQGVLWKNIPSGTYYPAVCLGNSSSGRVRIELVSGFDIL